MSDLLEQLIRVSTSPYHTAQAARQYLISNDFIDLSLEEPWQLENGQGYVLTPYDSMLVAFTVGDCSKLSKGIRLAAAHGDFPGFRIKPQPELKKDGYVRLNVEGYGGVNLMSWLDRPLSIAGRVALRSDDVWHPAMRLIDFHRPMLTIPNIAIHMERTMNQGLDLKKQSHMLPLLALDQQELSEHCFLELLAEELKVDVNDILDYELNVYNAEDASYLGLQAELLQAPRLDNLTSCTAILEGLTESLLTKADGLKIGVIFDHEEIGSGTKQGAGSELLQMILRRIVTALGLSEEAFSCALASSMFLSVDVAHAYHPAYDKHYDPKHHCIPSKGFCIKQAASQTYATDSEAISIVQQICDLSGIPYQKYVNHADERGGSTLGSIASTFLPVRTVDIGVPILAMHSARETMGIADQDALTDFIKLYYTL